MLIFSDLRRQLEVSRPVMDRFAKEGEFTISAGVFSKSIAKAFGVEKEAAAVAAALGDDTVLFRARKRANNGSVPVIVGPSAFANGSGVVVVTADLAKIDTTVSKYRMGPGGYVLAALGKTTVSIPLVISDELRNDLISAKDDGQTPSEFVEQDGQPPLTMVSPFDGETIPTVKPIPQRDIPPHSDDVPRLVDLEVVEVLEPSRQYKSPRLTVSMPDGGVIVGLIATQPIVRALTGQFEGAVELTDAVVGQKFQILDVEERVNRNGEKYVNADGTVQKSVTVRNSTVEVDFTF